MFFNLFDLALKNPLSRKAHQQHDAKPTSSYFEDSDEDNDNSILEQDKKITFNQAVRLGQALGEILQKHNYPPQLIDDLINFVLQLGLEHRLFPDMDTIDIWYTDHYDIIQCAEKLGLGDPRLPHWPEETNTHKRYLELSKTELVGLFIIVANDIANIDDDVSAPISVDWDNELKCLNQRLEAQAF